MYRYACHFLPHSWQVTWYMAPNDRTQQEQIRKRRKNLLKRLDEFVRRYKMRIWMTMEMPSGRIYTYRSNPDEAAPTDEEIVSRGTWCKAGNCIAN